MVRSRIGAYMVLLVVAISLVSWAAMQWASRAQQRQTASSERRAQLEQMVRLLAATFMEQGDPRTADAQQLQQQIERYAEETGLYLTLIADGGRVLADSRFSPRRMENQAETSEISAARQAPFGYAERIITEAEGPLQLVARTLTYNGETVGFLRAGLSREQEASSTTPRSPWLTVVAVATVLVGIVLVRAVERRAVDPVVELTAACDALAANQDRRPLWNSSRDEVGRLVRSFQSMAQAVTEREAALRDQANRIETVLGSMVEGVIAVNAQRVVLLANQAVRRLLDIRGGKIEGWPLIEVTRIRSLDQAVQNALKDDQPYSTEFTVNSPFRRVLSIQANRLPGVPCPGVVVVLHDVTDLRRLENLRREFVANVSHELKTPLAAIRAYAETLQLGAVDDPENRDYFLKQITDQSDRLHELIMDMLQLARVEAGQEVFDIADVPVREVIESTVDSLRDKAAAKGIDLVLQSPDTPIAARADEEGLRTIVGNLVDNAVKYSGRPGEVLVRWQAADEQVEICVEDHGIGIPHEAQQRIFERFYRVDKARSREMGGTGLGLSIVKHLVHAFGGTVELDSEEGRGTLFRVRLPRSQILTN